MTAGGQHVPHVNIDSTRRITWKQKPMGPHLTHYADHQVATSKSCRTDTPLTCAMMENQSDTSDGCLMKHTHHWHITLCIIVSTNCNNSASFWTGVCQKCMFCVWKPWYKFTESFLNTSFYLWLRSNVYISKPLFSVKMNEVSYNCQK